MSFSLFPSQTHTEKNFEKLIYIRSTDAFSLAVGITPSNGAKQVFVYDAVAYDCDIRPE